jgi:hypothetical protein
VKRRGASAEDRVPRYRQIIEKGGAPMLPNPGPAGYLVDYWKDAGCGLFGGMGITPLTSEEVLAWQNGTHTPLSPWEFQAVLEISRAYAGFLQTAREADCPPPYGATVAEVDREKVGDRLAAAFDALAGVGKRKPVRPVKQRRNAR